ncbi:hypothetical protein [uncultured Polaribacter sp.]|mgnify:CR=1 FL=1|uniref:hypothetical protein n=1 Tax=uncultured Polaribacter sp. TaxID=174711 RepID=UPI00259BBCE5|nr:hypothetical protein [uncultured Polaribacter sp.]
MRINVFDESSKSQKEIISVLYRIILILYSIVILVLKDFTIPFWYTALYFILFFTIYILLYNKDKFFSFLRLLNDYAFIGLTVYSVQIVDIYTLGLLFLPILNAQNHTGKKKSFSLYIFPIIIILLVRNKIDYYLFIPFLAFFIINSFELIKNKYQSFYNELNSSLDDFLIEESSMDKLHNIYNVIIPIFNKHKFFSKEIKDIICFQKNEDSMNVVNGSAFVFDYLFHDKKELFDKNKKLIYNAKGIILNSNEIKENVILKIDKNSIDYMFLIIPDENSSGLQLSHLPFFYKLLYPFFFRLSHVFNFKRVQNIDNRKNFHNIAKKVTYVNNAINSMHFTRNKLSPLKTYLSMIDDYEKEKSEDRRTMIEPFLKEERKKLKTSLDLILGRADIILEKSNNPFNVLDSDDYSFMSVLVKVRDSASYYLKSEKFEFIFDEIDFSFSRKIKVNETGIELILSNWFSNVNKYKSIEKYGVIVNEDEKHYMLKFFNKFTNKDYSKNPDFVEDFNSNDRMAILKRKTHGLIEIKDFLEQMGIDGNMSVDKDMLYFEICFLKNDI